VVEVERTGHRDLGRRAHTRNEVIRVLISARFRVGRREVPARWPCPSSAIGPCVEARQSPLGQSPLEGLGRCGPKADVAWHFLTSPDAPNPRPFRYLRHLHRGSGSSGVTLVGFKSPLSHCWVRCSP
jgi:hypothetical protein